MSTIKFSAYSAGHILLSAATAAPNSGLINSVTGTQASIISGASGANISSLAIFKGAIPDFSTFTDRSTRSSDLLITFVMPINDGGFEDLGIVNQSQQYLIGICPTDTAATASGTATWFLLYRNGTTTLTDKGAMIGNIGTIGSGADLEIPTTAIVSGQNYQSAGFYINMPQIWTVP